MFFGRHERTKETARGDVSEYSSEIEALEDSHFFKQPEKGVHYDDEAEKYLRLYHNQLERKRSESAHFFVGWPSFFFRDFWLVIRIFGTT